MQTRVFKNNFKNRNLLNLLYLAMSTVSNENIKHNGDCTLENSSLTLNNLNVYQILKLA